MHVGHFYFTGKTLLSDVAGVVRPECCMRVATGRFCNKIAATVLQNIHRIELLQYAADIGDTWLPVQPPSTYVAEQL